MSEELQAPTKMITLVLVITGAAAAGSWGKSHFHSVGMWMGIFLGGLLGWLAGWWVKRTFLEF